MPPVASYDPAGKPSATTNRLDPKLATREVRLNSQVVGDCTIVASGTTLTIQFYDMLHRPMRSTVAFMLVSLNGALAATGLAAETDNKIPAAGTNPTTGYIPFAESAQDVVLAFTDTAGKFVATIGAAAGADTFSVLPFAGHYNSGAWT